MHRAPVVLALLLPLLTTGCGGDRAAVRDEPSASPSIPSVSDIAGEVVVADLDAVRLAGVNGDRCVTRGAYADIATGTRVEVRSDTGTIKAVTALLPGRLRREGTAARPPGCVFQFGFTNAPAGRPTYAVRVAARPPVTVSWRDLTWMRIVFGSDR